MKIKAKPIQWIERFTGFFYVDLAYGFSIEYFEDGCFRAYKHSKFIDIFDSLDKAKIRCQGIADEFVNEIAELTPVEIKKKP